MGICTQQQGGKERGEGRNTLHPSCSLETKGKKINIIKFFTGHLQTVGPSFREMGSMTEGKKGSLWQSDYKGVARRTKDWCRVIQSYSQGDLGT